jgi:hypothetical protein
MGGGGLATLKCSYPTMKVGEEKFYFLEACLVFAPCGPNFQHLELLHSHQSSSFDLFLLLNFETYYCFFTFFLTTKISRIIQSPLRLCMHLILAKLFFPHHFLQVLPTLSTLRTCNNKFMKVKSISLQLLMVMVMSHMLMKCTWGI